MIFFSSILLRNKKTPKQIYTFNLFGVLSSHSKRLQFGFYKVFLALLLYQKMPYFQGFQYKFSKIKKFFQKTIDNSVLWFYTLYCQEQLGVARNQKTSIKKGDKHYGNKHTDHLKRIN